MAETVHLFLKANGSDVQGESTQTSLEREHSIECVYFSDAVRTAREASTGVASGRRSFEPITLTKRIDKSSPLLAKALCNNENLEGEFRFYRPSPIGDGTTQHFYTVAFKGGRVAHIKRISPLTFDPASSTEPPYEEVGLVFHTIRWTHEPDGIEHEDSWSQSA